MIDALTIPIEPWQVREATFAVDQLPQTESLFALANGHIGLRGNLDEGEPYGLPGTYLNSFFESRPLAYAEAGYGYPESGQTIVNVTNGKIIRLLVDDEPMDVRYGELRQHERVLDLKAGTLTRRVEWTSPAGRTVRIRSVRMVSLAQRAVAAIRYEVEPVDGAARIIVQSELVANEAGTPHSGDPRVAAMLDRPLAAEDRVVSRNGAVLVHSTRRSRLRMAAAMTHVVEGPSNTVSQTEAHDDWARTTVTCVLQPGRSLTITKFLAYGWSSERSVPAMRDQVSGALAGATAAGWDELLASQRGYLDEFWDSSDVEVDGDAELQQAVRFALFHVLQSGARAEQRAIAAKGLTGPGYDGHAFWDTESFVLPVLTYIRPEAVRDELRWRHSTLGLARERATQLGFAGAAFPWRTIAGQECSGYWPAGTAAFHVNADIADAVIRYEAATHDGEFERRFGLELLVEIARLLRSLGHHDTWGAFHIHGVTGPDEYTALGNDNIYTNLMAQRALVGAAEAVGRHPDRAHGLGVNREEAASWRDAAAAMAIPYDDARQVHQQCDGYTNFQEWDFDHTSEADYPLLLHRSYFDLYRKQVSKQADLVLAMHLRSDAFTWEQKARNFDYYEARTVRDSSLSACTQAIVAADVGHTRLAYDYVAEAALMDLRDIEHNTSDGLHIASLAGAWLGLVAGFGGLRDHDGILHFDPTLPSEITRLAFSVRWQGARLRVEVVPGSASYSLRDHGGAITIVHNGEEITVAADVPVTMPLQRPDPLLPEPRQPPGRAPVPRGVISRLAARSDPTPV